MGGGGWGDQMGHQRLEGAEGRCEAGRPTIVGWVECVWGGGAHISMGLFEGGRGSRVCCPLASCGVQVPGSQRGGEPPDLQGDAGGVGGG